MIIQDIQAGRGVGFVDPHGEAAEEILDFIPKERIKDVFYFDPGDINHPVSFNVMEEVDPEVRHLVASGLMGVFKKIWPDVWSARMEYILHNCVLALLEYPNSTLLGINRMLADADYRKEVVENVKDPVVKSFWIHEFGRYSERYEVEASAAIQNKIGQFISSPLIRNIIGQEKSSIDIRKMMDNEKIIILNLSKGKIGEDASKLLGGLLITKIQLAAMSRVDVPESKRKDFYLYVDEFQNFATESFCNILSEARKYRLSLTLAHQYIAQMEEEVRDAVFGNMGTIISFRVGAEDAEHLEKEFYPEFTVEDFVNLPKYQIYLKLMVEGLAGRPFSAETLPPFEVPEESFKDEIIELSRKKYANDRKEVEEKISQWTGDFILKSPSKKVKLHDAVCQKCDKKIKVPFKPDPNKPVYCKSCLKEVKGEKGEKKKGEKKKGEKKKGLTFEEMLIKNPVSFSNKKKSKKKDVDKEKLKKALNKSLDDKKRKTQIGELKPGEEVDFD